MTSKRRFLLDIILLVFLNLLVKPIWIFGIDRTVQNEVGSVSYGMYFALFNFSYLFNSLLDLGITNYNNRSVAQNSEFLKDNFTRLTGIKAGLGGLYLIITLGAAFLLGYDAVEIHLLLFLTLNQFLTSLLLFFRSNISGMQRFAWDSFASIADRVLLILICAYLLWVWDDPFQVEWLVYSQTVSLFIAGSIVAVVAQRFGSGFSFSINRDYLIQLLRNSIPFAVIILFMSMYSRLDAIMLERLLDQGSYYSGVYAQGYRILDMLNNFTFLFTGILFPLLSMMLFQKDSIREVVSLSIRLLLIPAGFVALSGWFFREEIINLLYAAPDPQSYTSFSWLMVSFLFLILASVFGTVLTAAGELKTMIWITGISFVLNLGLNWWIIPSHQAQGAAVATLAAQGFCGLGTYFYCVKKNYIEHFFALLIRFLMATIVAGIAIYFMVQQDMSIWLVSGVGIMLYLAVLLVNGFVGTQEIEALKKLMLRRE